MLVNLVSAFFLMDYFARDLRADHFWSYFYLLIFCISLFYLCVSVKYFMQYV